MNSNDPPVIRRRKNVRTLRSRSGLIQYARNNTSQNGEDGIISRLFDELLPPPSPSISASSTSLGDGGTRFCVDVGAWDGIHLSNTYSLLVDSGKSGKGKAENTARADSDEVLITNGSGNNETNSDASNRIMSKWKGVLIEADPNKFQDLKDLHDPLGNLCICAAVSCQPNSPDSLLNILKRNAPDLPQDFDFLTIDVDGTDYWLLADILGVEGGIDNQQQLDGDTSNGQFEYYRPKVICIEFNPTMPPDLVYIQPRNDAIRHGSSLSALHELAQSAGYELVETTLFNAFFIEKSLYENYLKAEVPDTSIEALHDISMGTSLYQLYDGSIKLWGCRRMLWHRMPIEEEKMQMLSLEQRSFPFAPSGGAGVEGNSNDSLPQVLIQPGASSSKQSLESKQKNERIREAAIDMSSYCPHHDEEKDCINSTSIERLECASRLIQTLHTDGFALVKGTGIPGSLCDDALKAAKSFLHDANEDVRRSCLTKDRARRGYSPMCTENFASLVGKKGPNDLVKKFRVGPLAGSSLDGGEVLSSLHQPNAWPADEAWDSKNSSFFRSTIEKYYEKLCEASECVLHAICDGIIAENAELLEYIKVVSERRNLENPRPASDHRSNNHTSILTLLGYQLGSRHKKGSKGYMRPLVAAHTDVGMITVLLFDSGRCASLQRAATSHENGVDPEKNDWVDVNLPEGLCLNDDPVFVVNVGDCLSDLSGGLLRSTFHRVVPRPCHSNKDEVARTCLALFVGLEPTAQLIFPLTGEVTYEEWRRKRIARASAVLKSEGLVP